VANILNGEPDETRHVADLLPGGNGQNSLTVAMTMTRVGRKMMPEWLIFIIL